MAATAHTRVSLYNQDFATCLGKVRCTGEAVVAIGKLRHRAAEKRLRELLHGEFGTERSYVWTNAEGTVNEEVDNWKILHQALGRILDSAETCDSCEQARVLWPLT